MDTRPARFAKLSKNRSKKTDPYPDSARRLALEYAREQLERGEKPSRVARTLGIAPLTLESWMLHSAGLIRPVTVTRHREVVTVKPSSSPVVVMPSGVRVEGLAVDDVVDVLRALG